jgi:hypothetical protein
MLSPLAQPIPPEGHARYTPAEDSHDGVEAWRRFAEDVDLGVCWNPDTVVQPRLDEDYAIQLEIRGVTAQKVLAPVQRSASPYQIEFWAKQTAHKNATAAKLREVGEVDRARGLEDCHSFYTIGVCCGCSTVSRFPNRCDKFYCAECQPRLGKERQQQVEWWTHMLRQPKHVVLTMQNVSDLSPGHVDELRKCFTKLRRRKFASNWTGGFYSIEVTNEGKGWHLHLHALIEAKWIDSAELALSWHSITRGFGRIVKVRDVRDRSYLAEVTKYVAKGAQLAAWSGESIRTFINAFEGKRTFGVFGELYGARTEFAEFIATLKTAKTKCQCGCNSFRFYTEAEFEMRFLVPNSPTATRPPPAPAERMFAEFERPRWPD